MLLTILGSQTSFASTTRNGITTSSYGAWGGSYSLAAASSPLVLNGGTLDVASSFTFTREINLGTSGGTVLSALGATLEVTGTVTGSGALIKQGAGTLTMSGANTYTGTTTISAGTLSVTGSLADTTAVTVASGATYNVGANDTIASIAGAGAVNLNSYTLTVGDANSTTYSGVMSGTGNLIKQGAGTLTMSGANPYSGGTTVNAGTLFGGAGSLNNTVFDFFANSSGNSIAKSL